MKESELQSKMARRGRSRRGYFRKVHGGIYGAGLPDLIGCYRGVFLGIEVKLPKTRRTLTDRQRATLDEINKAGGIGVVLSSVRQLDHLLDSIDIADTWPVANFGADVVRERLCREAKERLERGYRRGISTLEQRLGG